MRSRQPSEIASPVVVLLPFEMEYLMEKTGVARDVFRLWPLAWTPEVTIEIGMLDLGKPCPFLDGKMQCRIHAHNPLDCRTFPLLPFLNYHLELEWERGENCPSLSLLSPKFVDAVQRVWQELLPVLPLAWWDLYAFADHWTGWPDPRG
jgi:Fe-S-cluster containining protein